MDPRQRIPGIVWRVNGSRNPIAALGMLGLLVLGIALAAAFAILLLPILLVLGIVALALAAAMRLRNSLRARAPDGRENVRVMRRDDARG